MKRKTYDEGCLDSFSSLVAQDGLDWDKAVLNIRGNWPKKAIFLLDRRCWSQAVLDGGRDFAHICGVFGCMQGR